MGHNTLIKNNASNNLFYTTILLGFHTLTVMLSSCSLNSLYDSIAISIK